MKRESFVFYRSFFESIRKLSKRDQATIYSQICRYALDGELDELTGVPAAIFDLIKPQIDANLRRYENGAKGAEYGKLGGRPKTPKEPLNNPKQTPNVNVNVNENVNDNENVNVNVPQKGKQDTQHTESDSDSQTNRPSNIEIARTILEEGYQLDGASIKAFVEYNEERGWKMDWKQALKRWVERERPPEQNRKPFVNKFQNFERNRDNDEMARKIIQMQLGGNT